MNVSVKEPSPQQAIVLEYLKSGRLLTPMVALLTLGVASLTSRIAEIRRIKDADGKRVYVVEDRWDKDHFERRYKTYWLQGVPKSAIRQETTKG